MSVTINGSTGIDTPALDSDALPTVNGGEFPLGSFRNKIQGGDFTTNPWQRGTSFTGPANLAYNADRWLSQYSMDGVVDVLKTADAPTAAQAGVFTQHCLHVDVTTADASLAVGQFFTVRQNIEGLNAASFGFGQSGTRNVTLSFWHKHTKTGTYCVSLINGAGTRSYVAEYVQDVTDTWEMATVTIPVDTSGTWLYDTGIGVRLVFTMAAAGVGGTYTTTPNAWQAGAFFSTANQVNALDSTANNFKIALVQLESGSVSTPFEARGVGQELALAKRYNPAKVSTNAVDGIGQGNATTTTRAIILVPHETVARSQTTGIAISNASHFSLYDGVNSYAATSVAFNSGGVDGTYLTVDVASGLTQWRNYSLYFNNASGTINFTGPEL